MKSIQIVFSGSNLRGGGYDMREMALYEYLFKCIKSDYFISTCLKLFKIKINERVVSEQK